MTEPSENEDPKFSKPVTKGNAEDALHALGNLLYLMEIDHSDVEHLEAYLIMARTQIETLNRWFYNDLDTNGEEL